MRPQRIEPGPGQESVWDYPRPPAVVPCESQVEVWFGERRIAATSGAVRVLETSQAPAFYLPPDSIEPGVLAPSTQRSTWCEWKGAASYLDVVVGERRSAGAAWTYLDPTAGFESIAGHVAFYPQRVDRCVVDGEIVEANGGDFYGGWITSKVVGPFKGTAGTSGW